MMVRPDAMRPLTAQERLAVQGRLVDWTDSERRLAPYCERAEPRQRALLVITAGFAEVDAAGRALQRRLLEKVRGHGMRMVGPNCLGLLNTDPEVRLNASFSPVLPPAGEVAMASQSGALGLAILSAARRLDLGLSTVESLSDVRFPLGTMICYHRINCTQMHADCLDRHMRGQEGGS